MSTHPTAIIDPSVKVPESAEVGPYAVIEAGVTLGERVRIEPHAVIRSGVQLAAEVEVGSFSCIGGDPQSLSFDRKVQSGVTIGKKTVIRESVTVHRASVEGGMTVVGEGCFLMAGSHVAHDCRIDDAVIIANNVMLGGFVHVQTKAFVGGGAGIHQFVRIGRYAMVAGNASISADVPPYIMAAERNEACGLNLVGLRRAHFQPNALADLKRCYRAVFYGGGNFSQKAAMAGREHEFGNTEPGIRFLQFFENSKRGFVRSRNGES